MAIVWTVDIANVDVGQKRADVSFVRLDDTTGATENYNFRKAIIETTQQRLALLDLVWDKHIEAIAGQTAIDAFITNLEQLGKANLEAREHDMADTGYNWGAWAFVQDEDPSDWGAEPLADAATEISGTAISLDGKAACIVGIGLYEDNTGAIDGVVKVYVLGETDVAYEETTIGSPWAFTITPIQNDTVYKQFAIDPRYYDNFKIAVENQCGQALAVTVKYKTATIPVAS